MPYIKNENNRRNELKRGETAKCAGELNYQLFSYLLDNMLYDNKLVYNFSNLRFLYVSMNNFLGDNPNYQRYNDLYGAVICCYDEFKRRYKIKPKILIKTLKLFNKQLADYEDEKIKTNGDV